MPWQVAAMGVIFLLGCFMSFLMCLAIWTGKPLLAALTVWLASPVPILGIGVFIEHRNLLDMIDPAKQAYSALFGDLLILPVVIGLLAYAVKRYPVTTSLNFYLTMWALCFFLGVLTGLLFHLYDAPHYTQLAANSPGKWAHDGSAWPAISTGLLFGFITVLSRRESRKVGFVALAAFAVFAVLMVVDSVAPHWNAPLHVQFDYNTWQVIPYN